MNSRQNTISLTAITSAHGINHIYQLLLPLVLPKVAVEYDLNNFSAGLLIAVFSLSYALFQTPFGAFSKRLGRKRMLCIGFSANAIVLAAISFSQGIYQLAALLFIAGIGGSTYHPLGIHFISDLFPNRRGEALGYHQTGGSAGSFLAPLLIGFLAEGYGWRFAFLFLSMFGFAIAAVLWALLKENADESQGSFNLDIRALGTPLILISASALYSINLRGVQSFAAKYFQDGKGVQYLEATVLYAMLQVAGMISGPLSGRLSDVFGRVKVIAGLIIIQSISVGCIVFSSGILLYVPCITFGFASFGLLATSDAFIVDMTKRDMVGAALGINLAMSFFMSVIIPPVIGSSIDIRGYDQSFIYMTAISLLSLFPLSILAKKRKEG